TGLERLAVGAHDGAEFDVLKIGVSIAPAAGDSEELFKMLALAVINDVEDRVWMPGFVAELDRGEVAGRVEERAVLLLDDHWRFKSFDKNNNGALAVLGEAFTS